MPPKRKADTSVAEPASKRRTRSSVHPAVGTQAQPEGMALRSSPTKAQIHSTSVTPTRRVTRTYGSARKRAVLAKSLKENGSEQADESGDIPEHDTASHKLVETPESQEAMQEGRRIVIQRETRPADKLTRSKHVDYEIQVNANSGDSESESDDELMLSPSKPSRGMTPSSGSRTGTPRLVLDRVEISTPSKRSAYTTQRDDPCSLAPSASHGGLDTTASPSSRRLRRKPPVPDQLPVISVTTSSPKKSVANMRNLPRILPPHLCPCLNEQKRAILRALQSPPHVKSCDEDDTEFNDPPANEVAMQQLNDLLQATVTRGEGNSCLVLGPRGSGKTRIVERCISELPQKPIIIRLSGWTEYSDRMAMREIAYQLSQQTGKTYRIDDDDPSADNGEEGGQEANPFLDNNDSDQTPIMLPPPSHLPALISSLPTLPRPTVIILDSFDLFALHPRQALLYCLLDTVQSCRAGAGRNALAVIGVTSRVDTINLLEKRVKSRFSGRTLRTAHPRVLNVWKNFVKDILTVPIENSAKDVRIDEWQSLWKVGTDSFLQEKAMENILHEMFSVNRDLRVLTRLLTALVLQLSPPSPFPSISQLTSVVSSQRLRLQYPNLHTLQYPSLCMLIACMHSQTAGHDNFTFEMLYESFSKQVRASTAAPIQINGGNVGMVRCSRPIMMGAFEELVAVKTFVCVTPSISTIAREFIKYRCAVDHEDVKKAVVKTGHTYLKRWMNKPQ